MSFNTGRDGFWESRHFFTTFMERRLRQLRVWEAWKRLRRLPVSALSEDLVTAKRADALCSTLSRQLGAACEVTEEKWPISELRMPQLRAIAAEEAAQACLLIVSVHHGQSLPHEMRACMDLWLKRKSRNPMVLLALFDPIREGDSTSMAAELKWLADKAHAELLVHADESTDLTRGSLETLSSRANDG